MNFIGLGAALGSPSNQLIFQTPPATIAGVLSWAFLTNYTPASGQNTDSYAVPVYNEMTRDDEFASYNTGSLGGLGTISSAYAASTFAAASFAGAGASTNVRLTAAGTYTVTANTTVNALLLAGNGFSVSIAPGVTLAVDTGLVISAAGSGVAGQAGVGTSAANSISGGNLSLNLSGFEHIITDPANTLTISSSIGASNTINAGGKGTLVLAGPTPSPACSFSRRGPCKSRTIPRRAPPTPAPPRRPRLSPGARSSRWAGA